LLIFPGFEALDAFGPMEVVNDLSRTQDLTLSIIAATLDPVSTQWKGIHSVGQRILLTHTFADAPALDVLLVPGGRGAVEAGPDLLDYIRTTGPKVDQLITVCNGAALVAQTGILDGKSATTNKAYWTQCVATGPKVNWVAKARWVRDGNTWTSSGVSAGIDVTLAWVESQFGAELATSLANSMEFERAQSSTDDPFAVMYNCKDVPAQV
jgi:transcriptional regulator GlxA family with amidase domain